MALAIRLDFKTVVAVGVLPERAGIDGAWVKLGTPFRFGGEAWNLATILSGVRQRNENEIAYWYLRHQLITWPLGKLLGPFDLTSIYNSILDLKPD